MNRLTAHRRKKLPERKPWTPLSSLQKLSPGKKLSLPLFCAALIFLCSCGGSGNPNPPGANSAVAGNWQFTMAAPPDNSFLGGIQGGFLTQNNTAVNGAVIYRISLPATQSGGATTLCNSGSAPVTGSITGQNVTFTVIAGTQTFNLTGSVSSGGSTMSGTYSSTDGKGCGTAQQNLQWTAILVPPLTGTVQGNFHSVIDPTLQNQVFSVTGSLTQGQNIGASNATVTGTLQFTGYPCLSSASVNGQVSGTSVILQIIASSGANVGQIGAAVGFSNPYPVTVLTSAAGTVIQGAKGYGISTSSCPGGNVPGDVGDICLGLGNNTSCTQPILLTPASIIFPLQQVGSAPTSQAILLTNNNLSGTSLSNLSLSLNPQSGATSPFGLSDFDSLANFTEQDNCASPAGSTFSLAPQQSCTITISFSPQQSCPWLPAAALGGQPPTLCPYPMSATLTVNSPSSADSDTAFAVPISGSGFSAIVPSTAELDFGAEAVGESSASQLLTLTNQGVNPVQILPALSTPCVNPASGVLTLARPISPGTISGLLVDSNIAPNGSTINYNCDSDLTSKLANFQISGDGCSGTLLTPLSSCNLMVTFSPQPSTPLTPALDYFLELNTLQCTSTTTANCEIDSGRFPVELKANLPSPLRMTPSAGLSFPVQGRGITSSPMTVTLFNDPKDPNAGTINFTGIFLPSANFGETSTCVGSLAPGASCTVTVTFTPTSVGFTSSTITIGYSPNQTQTVYLRGTGQ